MVSSAVEVHVRDIVGTLWLLFNDSHRLIVCLVDSSRQLFETHFQG